MSKVSVEINTKINELYSKTIITQKFINESENPLELKIFTTPHFFMPLHNQAHTSGRNLYYY
jgi:hypothetical protein